MLSTELVRTRSVLSTQYSVLPVPYFRFAIMSLTFFAESCADCSGVFTLSITSCIICGTIRFMMSFASGTAGKEMPYCKFSVVTLRNVFSASRFCWSGRAKASRLPGLDVSHWW